MPEAMLPAIVFVLCSERGVPSTLVRTAWARREVRRCRRLPHCPAGWTAVGERHRVDIPVEPGRGGGDRGGPRPACVPV